MIDWENEVGPGWRSIVRTAIGLLEHDGAEIQQVKEKFGGLRIYYAPETGFRDGIVAMAAELCAVCCEECDNPGIMRSDLLWIKTLCDQHYEERKKQHGQRQEGTNR